MTINMKVKHIASGTVFERNEKASFTVVKQGTKNDCWVNRLVIGHRIFLKNIAIHIDHGWFVKI
ncbi:MAG: hypothetical protein QM500_17450 [Methylococcales bacterium]